MMVKDIDELNKRDKESIYSILEAPDSYFHDKRFTRKERLKEIAEEERKEKTKEQNTLRAKRTIHSERILGMRKTIGMADKVLIWILQDSRKCRKIAHTLMAISTLFRKEALHVVEDHIEKCLLKGNYKSTEKKRIKEMQVTHELAFKLGLQLEALTELKTKEEAKAQKIIEEIIKKSKKQPPSSAYHLSEGKD